MRPPKTWQENGWHIACQWDWDYGEAWAYQRSLVERVRETDEKWLIVCSHPDVLTHGRGLQKAKKGQSFSLTEFSAEAHPNLPVPFYKIERGGGLTFHHPGQLILYPIVKLHPDRLGLSKLVDQLLLSVRASLESQGLAGLDHQRELLGLWRGMHKLASVGIAIDRMVTLHGLALNVQRFDALKAKLAHLAPCGMEFRTYTSVEELTGHPATPSDLMPDIVRRFTHGR